MLRWFLILNCLHSFATKYKLESHKKVCENKDLCKVLRPSEDTKILDRAVFIIIQILKV